METIAHSYLQQRPLRGAASEMRLSHVIEGSVLMSSDRCRVIINLIHVADGTQLWAREYELKSDDIFTSQAEIAGSVLREVTACLGLRRSQSVHLVAA